MTARTPVTWPKEPPVHPAACETTPDTLFPEPIPDPILYTEAELFVAGALSTMEPFSGYHPAYALPFARKALEALGEWEPTDGG